MKIYKLLVLSTLILIVALSTAIVVSAGSPTTLSSSTGALIKGVVKFSGVSPAPKPVRMAADPSCAKQHSGPVLSQEVLTDSKGDLQNAIVFISDGIGDHTFDPPAAPAVMGQKGCVYEPHVLALQANQPLEVVNEDQTTHNIHPTPANNREWNKAEPPGAKVEEAFAREEVAIPVKCNIHPWMRGYIAVFKHPYFAVTTKDGAFELPKLPPGTYTIKAWHEKLGTSTQTITVGPNQTKEVDFVFKAS